ncbi:MAG: hypothetical protein IJQ39_15340 [Thermoguttaceae bacterium]|nr:hypothetical protein [Thermoguttaceae bacterium]
METKSNKRLYWGLIIAAGIILCLFSLFVSLKLIAPLSIQTPINEDITCSIIIETDREPHTFVIPKDSELFNDIVEWKSTTRWYHISLVSYYPWMRLDSGHGTDDWLSINIWKDRIIVNSKMGQYVSCFFTDKDRAIRQRIEDYYNSLPKEERDSAETVEE